MKLNFLQVQAQLLGLKNFSLDTSLWFQELPLDTTLLHFEDIFTRNVGCAITYALIFPPRDALPWMNLKSLDYFNCSSLCTNNDPGN